MFHYICVDLERSKVRYARGAVEADAAALPFADGAVEGTLFFGVLHHLADGVLEHVIAEASRVLVSGGRLVMIDPIAVPVPKFSARALWSLDRGNHPRTREALDATLRLLFNCRRCPNVRCAAPLLRHELHEAVAATGSVAAARAAVEALD